MYLKVMGEGNLPDSDASKSCVVYSDVRSVEYCYHDAHDAYDLKITFKDGSTDKAIMYYEGHDYDSHVYRPKAYLMNEDGKTIQTFTLPKSLLDRMARARAALV